ncbi:MAG TPA: RNA 2',3'-cyclic phosphodiesterase [Rhodobacteraceae bacterium]|nr:RNA 2',3'-cyclic phosphodiesterase [Paracoccaceae bacterium]
MRVFLAIPLPDDLRDALAALQDDLQAGRAVPEENLHLTLAFLDEQPEEALAALDDELSALSVAPFELVPRGLGVFGGGRPRLLYAALAPSPALDDLHARVLRAVRRAGIELRRERFVPHVTLARFGAGARGTDLERVQHFLARHMAWEGPPLPVTGFGLYHSRLGPGAAVYEELATYPESREPALGREEE